MPFDAVGFELPKPVVADAELLAHVAIVLRKTMPTPERFGAPLTFNMKSFINIADKPQNQHWCSSTCCIAGYAAVVALGGGSRKEDLERYARRFATEHSQLCFARTRDNDHHFRDGVTESQAAQAIDNYLATGDCDWDSILPSSPGVP